jgi:hypothetical protein
VSVTFFFRSGVESERVSPIAAASGGERDTGPSLDAVQMNAGAPVREGRLLGRVSGFSCGSWEVGVRGVPWYSPPPRFARTPACGGWWSSLRAAHLSHLPR